MTTMVSWLSVSGTGKRTLYIGADSQGTSVTNGAVASNSVRKVWFSSTTPEIFSFSGDVGWGQSFLRTLVAKIKNEQVLASIGSTERAQEISDLACSRPPDSAASALEVFYAVREGTGRSASFHLHQLTHTGNSSDSWAVRAVAIDKLTKGVSTPVFAGGFGGQTSVQRQGWIASGDQGNVARTCFWSLCDLVDGKPRNDIMTGGYPQLVKLDETGTGLVVGVKYHSVPTVFGSRSTNPQQSAKVWVDETFTQLDPRTMKPYSRAQRYGRRQDGR